MDLQEFMIPRTRELKKANNSLLEIQTVLIVTLSFIMMNYILKI